MEKTEHDFKEFEAFLSCLGIENKILTLEEFSKAIDNWIQSHDFDSWRLLVGGFTSSIIGIMRENADFNTPVLTQFYFCLNVIKHNIATNRSYPNLVEVSRVMLHLFSYHNGRL